MAESYFGGRRKGKRANPKYSAYRKIYTKIIADVSSEFLMLVIEQTASVYSDRWRGYYILNYLKAVFSGSLNIDTLVS